MELNGGSVDPVLSFATALTADFIIAVSLCWLLGRHRTGFQRTDSIYGLDTVQRQHLRPHDVNLPPSASVPNNTHSHLRLLLPHHRTSPPLLLSLSLTRNTHSSSRCPTTSFISPSTRDAQMYLPTFNPLSLSFDGCSHVPYSVPQFLLATLNMRKHVHKSVQRTVMSIPLSAISGTHTVASADSVGKLQYGDTHEEQVLHVQIQMTVDKKTDSVTNINV
ncbi:hypothetical protein A0H81_04705 [Grifola frondosa]|uniref:Uncharacterized protein n=1 Tax=Grifola frondosa TaxID=5627 RepID=A0A1C7MF50_GRIFR|nr:hypothetical protein A0H81_04705 [Grifola frondosa]